MLLIIIIIITIIIIIIIHTRTLITTAAAAVETASRTRRIDAAVFGACAPERVHSLHILPCLGTLRGKHSATPVGCQYVNQRAATR